MSIFQRTAGITTLQAAVAIADTNKHECATAVQTIKANILKLLVTTTGICNTVTFTVAQTSDSGDTYFSVDREWTIESSAAGTYEVTLDGLSLIPGSKVKVYYQAETAAGNITVQAVNYMSPGGSGGVVDLSDVTIEVNLDNDNDEVAIFGNDGTYNQRIKTDTEGHLQIDVLSTSLDDVVGTEDAASPSKALSIAGKVATSQRAAMSDGDSIILTTNEHGELILNGLNWTGQYLDTGEANPLDEKAKGNTECDVTNGTDGTYDYFIDISNRPNLTLHGILDGGTGTCTVKMYLIVQDDGEAAATCSEIDISQYGFDDIGDGTTAASYTDDFCLSLKENVRGKYIHIEVVADTTAANDADWTIYSFKSAL